MPGSSLGFVQCQARTLLSSHIHGPLVVGALNSQSAAEGAPRHPGWATTDWSMVPGNTRQRPPAGLWQAAPERAGDSRLRGVRRGVESTSVALRGSSGNSEAKPSACSIRSHNRTLLPTVPRARTAQSEGYRHWLLLTQCGGYGQRICFPPVCSKTRS